MVPLIENGNETAFNELYARYGQRLRHYFYRMLGQQRERADDFTQELFLKVIQKAASFDDKRKFSTWLYTIAANMCKNEYRRLSRTPVLTIVSEREFQAVLSNIPEQIDQQLFDEQLQLAVQKLPIHHRQCFLLRYQEECSIKEISEILDCPLGTVKSRIHYCLKKLAEQLHIFAPDYSKSKKVSNHVKKR